MPRNQQPGLVGGRALYTGKNAYASQGFENDTRQRQLPGLAACYLAADRTNITADATAIAWGAVISSIGTSNIFLRGFTLLSDGATLQCRLPGTYRLTAGIRFTTIPVSTTPVLRVQVMRQGNVVYDVVAITQNVSASVVGGQTEIKTMPVPIDLQTGDSIYALIQNLSAGTVTFGASYSTGLYLEQLDANI